MLAALSKIGWQVKRQSGSQRTLARPNWPDVVVAFHDDEEIGPKMLARIAKRTGLASRQKIYRRPVIAPTVQRPALSREPRVNAFATLLYVERGSSAGAPCWAGRLYFARPALCSARP